MTQHQPTLFVPHGAPTFALRPGAAGAALSAMAKSLALPRAIIIVSAHWDTVIPTVGYAERPETIHDFWGFPDALYEIRYPATGCREASDEVFAALKAAGMPAVQDAGRGLDHGAWVPLRLCSRMPKSRSFRYPSRAGEAPNKRTSWARRWHRSRPRAF